MFDEYCGTSSKQRKFMLAGDKAWSFLFLFLFYFIFFFFFLVYIFTEYQIDFVEELQKSDFLLVEHKLSEVYEKFWDCIDCTQPDCCFVFRSDQNKDKK